jgi:gamma-glutamylcyclotransferase (GGCT)/AIG2-like uncharacterized protein YtfP
MNGPAVRRVPFVPNGITVPNTGAVRTVPEVRKPLPLFFVYGTLQSKWVLAKCLFGDETESEKAEERMQRATLHGYKRHAVKNEEYPAAIKGEPTDKIHGTLCCPKTAQEVMRIMHSENTSFKTVLVKVENLRGLKLPAFTWVWCGDLDELEDHDWSLAAYQREWDLEAMLNWE